ncbi:adenylyltransferase [Halobacteriales archaeon SW_7_68_16]|nr:MAG: adenylyltransferase [Halobacteriales archaeon SW_7_68_16]
MFGPEELDRYARQIVLPEVGAAGQERLRSAAVLVVGAGGIGGPAIRYLAGAGVGRLGVADGDVVERSNLHRQTIYTTADVGEPKADRAAAFVADLNPTVAVETHDAVDAATAEATVTEYDIVVDCTDRLRARYLVNDACELVGRPHVSGAVERFAGHMMTFVPDGPCYRCLFPDPPPADAVPDCAEVGVLGVVPGLVGTAVASETLGLLLDIDGSPAGTLRTLDARTLATDAVAVERDPTCPACGEAAVESIDGIDRDSDR